MSPYYNRFLKIRYVLRPFIKCKIIHVWSVSWLIVFLIFFFWQTIDYNKDSSLSIKKHAQTWQLLITLCIDTKLTLTTFIILAPSSSSWNQWCACERKKLLLPKRDVVPCLLRNNARLRSTKGPKSASMY